MFWGQSNHVVSATTSTSQVEQSSSTVGHGRGVSLSQSKVTSNQIEEKVKIAEKTQLKIAKVRAGYTPVAYHVSQLFFCIADLSMIDPMYQYSLQWFQALFVAAISKAEKAETLELRLDVLNTFFTYYVYVNVCRSVTQREK